MSYCRNLVKCSVDLTTDTFSSMRNRLNFDPGGFPASFRFHMNLFVIIFVYVLLMYDGINCADARTLRSPFDNRLPRRSIPGGDIRDTGVNYYPPPGSGDTGTGRASGKPYPDHSNHSLLPRFQLPKYKSAGENIPSQISSPQINIHSILNSGCLSSTRSKSVDCKLLLSRTAADVLSFILKFMNSKTVGYEFHNKSEESRYYVNSIEKLSKLSRKSDTLSWSQFLIDSNELQGGVNKQDSFLRRLVKRGAVSGEARKNLQNGAASSRAGSGKVERAASMGEESLPPSEANNTANTAESPTLSEPTVGIPTGTPGTEGGGAGDGLTITAGSSTNRATTGQPERTRTATRDGGATARRSTAAGETPSAAATRVSDEAGPEVPNPSPINDDHPTTPTATPTTTTAMSSTPNETMSSTPNVTGVAKGVGACSDAQCYASRLPYHWTEDATWALASILFLLCVLTFFVLYTGLWRKRNPMSYPLEHTVAPAPTRKVNITELLKSRLAMIPRHLRAKRQVHRKRMNGRRYEELPLQRRPNGISHEDDEDFFDDEEEDVYMRGDHKV